MTIKFWTAALALIVAAPAGREAPMKLSITSPAFATGGAIPAEYTCEGADRSPPLVWAGVPAGAGALVLIVDDPDAPDPAHPQRTWVHWVLYDLPPSSTGLEENAGSRTLPAGTREGLNDWGRSGYGGPCPPIGRHRYFFKLYALDRALGAVSRPTKAAVATAIQGHILAEAELVGTYEKHRR